EARSAAGGEPLKERGLVEAALYSAGRALTIDELARTTRLDPEAIKGHLRALAGEYTKRESALEVAQIGTKWTMQIRSEYTERAQATPADEPAPEAPVATPPGEPAETQTAAPPAAAADE